ncbi:MAG: hypothetical protein AAB431_03100 [Patescibacteria group bacterium]
MTLLTEDRPTTSGSWEGGTTAKAKPDAILAVRVKHGFKPGPNGTPHGTTKKWRDEVLAGKVELDGVTVPEQSTEWPKNGPILNALEERYAIIGFKWRAEEGVRKGQPRKWVVIENIPKIGGVTPNLADLLLVEPELVDGYDQAAGVSKFADRIGKPVEPSVEETRRIMTATGVGYKGGTGVTWRQMIDPFALPTYFVTELGELGQALGVAFQAVYETHRDYETPRNLLSYRKPDRIPALLHGDTVGVMRPDIVVVLDPVTKKLRPVITEFESCPGGQGMAHAMELGYGLPLSMLNGYLRLLKGRRYIVLATNEWAEYTWEQACFIKALRDAGVDAELWFDRPLAEIHERVQTAWEPHKDISATARAAWNRDFLGRLRSLGFLEFVHGSDEGMPLDLGPETVIYRFGYLDNLVNTNALELLKRWHEQGAYVMNPLWYFLESKSLMAALWDRTVMDRIVSLGGQATLTTLHNCVAQTQVVNGSTWESEVANQRDLHLTKFAAWDGKNQSWGSRSIVLGPQAQNQTAWVTHLKDVAALPHPVVAQHIIASARYTVAYRDAMGRVAIDRAARTRLTPFFLFHGKAGSLVELAGATMTLRSKSFRIHGADDAEEGPVVFTDEL